MEWIKATERLPEKVGYYITNSIWEGDSPILPNERSDTYFQKGRFEPLKGWTVYEWLDESTPAIEDVKETAQKYADNVLPYIWPKNKKGEEIEQRVGQNAPGSAKHRKSQQPIIDAFLAGAAHIQKQGEEKYSVAKNLIEEYAVAGRVIHLHLEQFCDENLAFAKMIADAARKAAKRIEELSQKSIPSSIVRRLEEMRDKIFELAEKETDDFQRTVYFSHGSDINIASQLITKYASILLSPQPEIKLEEDINVAMAEGAEFVVTRMVGDDPQPAEQGEDMEQLAKEIWKMAMIYANNLCVGLSYDFNNDDEIVEASAASRCANLMKSEMNHPHPDVIVYAKKYNKSSPGGDYKLPGFDETMQQLQTLTIQPKKEDKS